MKLLVSFLAFVVIIYHPSEAQKNNLAACSCIRVKDPVCGTDGRNYLNPCLAKCHNVRVECDGSCPCQKSGGQCFCPFNFEPVCGVNGNDYDNRCLARCANEDIQCEGRCPCAKPEFCPAIFSPVCGADGETYSNSCVAGQRGVVCQWQSLNVWFAVN
ncbi:hypothetical protein TCAL_17406 [Tigriopus californicus]|uniref:Kazal-like domain-containing protein n=1 Tax=Tigriopus californicus TaxID=6832 RepID=A0A553NZH3_TIGCA|nr:hypothetical protein TCAL_17406 [Tigriopus californicus]